MDKCREEFEKQKYWIGLFRDAVDFDEKLGRYVLNGQRKLYAFHLDSFNEKWAIWQESWQHQQAKVEEAQKRVDACQKLLEKWKTTGLNGTSDYAVGGAHARQNCEDELEQALKGEG
ncbi:hypothetical protein NCY62_13865 [Acinetobacter pittii]|uniref:hypothetical protein n=1 Tax=Acinetobacter pittii TaxID=48296 RepID=UPI00202DD744|nr:hypothetical protein [Acinetobacter pittii]MCM1963187.1 hypothetical protein [Acinetobacter pittii]MCM1979586.1 hypothetical protein [Acinetobacter pittii]